jgi:hypothetical protein
VQSGVIDLTRWTDLVQPLLFDWWLGQPRVLLEQLPGLPKVLQVSKEPESREWQQTERNRLHGLAVTAMEFQYDSVRDCVYWLLIWIRTPSITFGSSPYACL